MSTTTPTDASTDPQSANRTIDDYTEDLDADACGALGCTRSEDLRRVEHPDRGSRVLCPVHERDFLGVGA